MNIKILFFGIILVLTACNEVKDTHNTVNQFQPPRQVSTYNNPSSVKIKNRVALVIGNADYKFAPLKNPVNDARDIEASLKKLGFEVIYEENANYGLMDTAISKFKKKLGRNTIGLFYFSGHGVQHNGLNYMIPVDLPELTASNVKYKSITIDYVLSTMEETNNSTNIIVLDACRNNPFRSSTKGINIGLASVTAPTGSLIAYATSPGNTAEDGNTGRNSPYTKHLKKFIKKPGLTIESVFKKVRNAVLRETNDKQTPWEANSLRGDNLYLAGKTTEEDKSRLVEIKLLKQKLEQERQTRFKQERLTEGNLLREKREREAQLKYEEERKYQEFLADKKLKDKRLAEERRLQEKWERKAQLKRAEERKYQEFLATQRLKDKRLAEERKQQIRRLETKKKRELISAKREQQFQMQSRKAELKLICSSCDCGEIRRQESMGIEILTIEQEEYKKYCSN